MLKHRQQIAELKFESHLTEKHSIQNKFAGAMMAAFAWVSEIE